MNKLLCTLLSGLLAVLLFAAPASAFTSPLPDEIKALMLEQHDDPTEVQDCILLTAPDGRDYLFTLSDFGSLNGWKKDGAWQSVLQTGTFDAVMEPLRFAPTAISKAMGFDIIASETGRRLSYSWDGAYFSLSGWYDPAHWEGRVWADGPTLRYIDFKGQEQAAVTADDSQALHSWISDWDSKPATPEEAMARAAIQRSAVQHRFDGWTLGSFESYNSGTETNAGYYRVENGLLSIRRATFHAGKEKAEYHDTMSVPLSAALLQRLESGSAEGLIDTSGYGSSFLTEDALDTARIPADGKMLQNDLQRGCLVLLAEEETGRYLYTVRQSSAGRYEMQRSPRLPADTALDTFHAGDGTLSLQWDGQNMQAGYDDTGSDWQLEWVMAVSSAESGIQYDVNFFGVSLMSEEDQITLWGDFPFRYLSASDPALLPRTREAVRAAVDATHWAAVSNPSAKDRLHLRTAPDKNALSLGKCWNGTPVYVLEKQGDWTKVLIGSKEHGLTGWMMTKYLAFGSAASNVTRAFPDKVAHEAYFGKYACLDAAMTMPSSLRISDYSPRFLIVGVTENNLYLLLDDNGHVGYAPQSWFWDGNG